MIGTDHEFVAACARAAGDLTDTDLQILESSHPQIAAERRAERAAALAKADAARVTAPHPPAAVGPTVREGSMLSAIARVTKELFTVRDTRLQALEQRIADLEARPPGVQYRGVWATTAKYVKDEAVTWDGSLWVARIDSFGTRPGTAPACWQLAVKRGADGKGAR